MIAIFYVSDGVRFRKLSYSIVEGGKGNIYYYYCIDNISYIYMIALFYVSDGVRFRELSYSIVEGEKEIFIIIIVLMTSAIFTL